MKLINLSLEELELMSYTDLAYELIKENKKAMNTKDLFKEICNLLDLSEDEFTNKIGDFYTSLTIDKRFLLLPENEWDLRDNHSVEISYDEEDEDEEEIEEEVEEEIEEEELDEDTLYDDENDVTDDDDMEDLEIVEEEDISEE